MIIMIITIPTLSSTKTAAAGKVWLGLRGGRAGLPSSGLASTSAIALNNIKDLSYLKVI